MTADDLTTQETMAIGYVQKASSGLSQGRISTVCVLSVWGNDINFKYIINFVDINSTLRLNTAMNLGYLLHLIHLSTKQSCEDLHTRPTSDQKVVSTICLPDCPITCPPVLRETTSLFIFVELWNIGHILNKRWSECFLQGIVFRYSIHIQ